MCRMVNFIPIFTATVIVKYTSDQHLSNLILLSSARPTDWTVTHCYTEHLGGVTVHLPWHCSQGALWHMAETHTLLMWLSWLCPAIMDYCDILLCPTYRWCHSPCWDLPIGSIMTHLCTNGWGNVTLFFYQVPSHINDFFLLLGPTPSWSDSSLLNRFCSQCRLWRTARRNKVMWAVCQNSAHSRHSDISVNPSS